MDIRCSICGEEPRRMADGMPRMPLQHKYGPTTHDYRVPRILALALARTLPPKVLA